MKIHRPSLVREAEYAIKTNPRLRTGQAYMTALYGLSHELYQLVMDEDARRAVIRTHNGPAIAVYAPPCDPFYDDANLLAFFEFLEDFYE